MSEYRHDLKKFADAGLQLRLPVDLIPPTQYGKLTNALPIIEGELRTRDGLALVGNVTEATFVWQLERPNTTDTFASIADTIYPNGLFVGDLVDIELSYGTGASTTASGVVYPVIISAILSPTQFSFTPGIPVTWSGIAQTIIVAAEVVSANPLNVLPATVITNLYRLNESIPGLYDVRLAVLSGRVFTSLQPGGTFRELVGPNYPPAASRTQTTGFSGRPMAIISFRFTKDTITWAILADYAQMYKYRPSPDVSLEPEFVPLGNAPPTVQASASAGGAGLLNSTGGTGYDWRYTYVDGLALTESNPSPISMTTGGTSTTRPTTSGNPANVGQLPFFNPGNAIDGSTTTASTGAATAANSGTFSTFARASCLWKTWPAPAGVVDALTLNVLADFSCTITTSYSVGKLPNGGTLGTVTLTLDYSYDNGATWLTLASLYRQATNGTSVTFDTGIQTYSVNIPKAVSPAALILRTTIVSHAITGLSASGTIRASGSAAIYDINTLVTQEGSETQLALTNQIGRVCVTPSPHLWQTFINLYRRGGSLPDNWRFVSQSQVSALNQGACGVGTLEIDDNVSDTQLSAQPIMDLDNDQPVSSVTALNQPLPFIWGPVGLDARVLGCGDPARPESVYYSKPGNADAWPPQNHVEVSSPGTPVIAGCVFNTRTFAFSRETIYELVEGLGTGSTFTPFRTPSAHGLFSAYALAVGPAMFFVAKDGIYMTTGGQEQSIVENDIKPLFPTYDTPGQSVEGYEAVDMTQPDSMRLCYHNDELYFGYVGSVTGTRQVLVYDLLKKRWRGITTTVGVTEIYSESDTVSSLLWGTNAGSVYQSGGAHDPAELDTIENIGITSVTVVSTSFPAISYYARVARYSSIGPVALSYEVPVTVSATQGIQVVFPVAPAGTVKWRVFYGPTSGAETQYQEFTDAFLDGAGRTVTIIAAGTAGSVPTVNASNLISVTLRTGANDQGAPLNRKQYGNVIFDLDPGGATVAAPVTITPLINGETQAQAALTVTGSGRQQVPLDLSDYFAFNTEYEIAWTRTDLVSGAVSDPILYQFDTLHFIEPVGVTHWSAQPTAAEFPGFMHYRDCYIAIRSTAAVTLTVTMDTGTGTPVVQTYTLPSTGGLRLKQYVQFASNKGLLYQFALDSTAEMRIYEPDIEFRCKPFLGLLGYSVQRLLGGEVNA